MTEDTNMPDRYVVEADRRVVGVAVRAPGGFRFFASDAAFLEADAKLFPRAKILARRIADIARGRRQASKRSSTPPSLH